MSTIENIPMLADSIDVDRLPGYVDSDYYWVEQKLDGHRILLRIRDDLSPLALTRGGVPYSKALPLDLTRGLPAGHWVLDGELVDGTLWVFDMLHANDLIDHMTPFWERRAVLEAFMSLVQTPRIRLVPTAKTKEEKRALVARCRKEGAEGVMVKVKTGTYSSGKRSADILKAKFVETADVVVLAVRDDGKDSVRLGAWGHTTKVMEDVGRASLIGKEKAGVIRVGDVLEVRYLYVGAGGRLYQPTIIGKRGDKSAGECTTAQFKHVRKTVLV